MLFVHDTFSLVGGLAVVVAIVGGSMLSMRRATVRQGNLRRAGAVSLLYALLRPLVAALARMGLTPNMVTSLSVVLALIAGVLLAQGYLGYGLPVIIAASICDALDGQLARVVGSSRISGAFLDSFADRLTDGVILGGLAIYGAGSLVTWAAIGALITSFAVSYARARGASLGVDAAIGIMQRPQRLILIIGAIAASALLMRHDVQMAHSALSVPLTVLTIASAMTAYARVRYVMTRLDLLSQESAGE